MTKKIKNEKADKLRDQIYHLSKLGEDFSWEQEEALFDFLEVGGDVNDLADTVRITPKFLMAVIKKELKGK